MTARPEEATASSGGIRTYYDRPVIAPPVWKWEIPLYFLTGGTAGAAAALAFGARRSGRPALARSAERVAAAAFTASPPLLVADLGRPARFINMLRVFRPTSPMNMGSWLLTAFGPAVCSTAVLGESGRLPRVQSLAGAASAILGLPMTTYTAVLVSNTAVPVWHDARRELPFVFAGSSAAAAGAATLLLDPSPRADPARRLAVLGAAAEQAATAGMEHNLGVLGAPYQDGPGARLMRAAKALTISGATVTALSGGRRALSRMGAGLLLAGAACTRFGVFKAGFDSAEDPRFTVGPQRERLDARS